MKYKCICLSCKYQNEKWSGEHCAGCEGSSNFVPIGQEEEDPYQTDMDEAWNQVKHELESGFYHTEREELSAVTPVEKPCEDAISRQAVLDAIDNERKSLLDMGMKGAEHIVVHHARRIIEELPSVTPAENRVYRKKAKRWKKKYFALKTDIEKAKAEIDSYCSENRDRNDGLYIAMKIIDKRTSGKEEE